MRPPLRLDFVGHEAALWAVRAFHYSRALPAGKQVRVGVFEADAFRGCAIFSRGAAMHIGKPYGLRQSECCELTRLALAPHPQRQTPTSRILRIALLLLHRQSPGVRLVVSYADPQHGHDGRGVYGASGWIYCGVTNAEALIQVRGRLEHPRTVASRYGTRDVAWLRANVDPQAARTRTLPKHKWLYIFDDALRERLAPLARPCPVRRKEQASAYPAELGGATPTSPLTRSWEAR